MGPRVLIVDDEAMVRENLKAYLEDEKMRVVAVESAEAAVKCIKSGQVFSVCIMDIRLPGMDGNAAIRILNALCPALRFVIHTGLSNFLLPNDLRALGLRDAHIFHKPLLDMEPLAQTIRALAGHTRDPE